MDVIGCTAHRQSWHAMPPRDSAYIAMERLPHVITESWPPLCGRENYMHETTDLTVRHALIFRQVPRTRVLAILGRPYGTGLCGSCNPRLRPGLLSLTLV